MIPPATRSTLRTKMDVTATRYFSTVEARTGPSLAWLKRYNSIEPGIRAYFYKRIGVRSGQGGAGTHNHVGCVSLLKTTWETSFPSHRELSRWAARRMNPGG